MSKHVILVLRKMLLNVSKLFVKYRNMLPNLQFGTELISSIVFKGRQLSFLGILITASCRAWLGFASICVSGKGFKDLILYISGFHLRRV